MKMKLIYLGKACRTIPGTWYMERSVTVLSAIVFAIVIIVAIVSST